MYSQYSSKSVPGPTVEDKRELLDKLEQYIEKLEGLEPAQSMFAKIANNLRASIPPPPFSKIDLDTLAKVGIHSDAALVLSADKRGKIEGEGKDDAAAGPLSFDATKQVIKSVRSCLVTEAGCRMLINIIILRVASSFTVHDKAQMVNIMPEFPVKATFETDSDNCSFSGVVDYLLVQLPPADSEWLLSFSNRASHLHVIREMVATGAVIRAEQDNLEQAIPRAAITVAAYCNEQELSIMRGCITSGEQWTFFVYKCPKALGGRVPVKREGEFYFSRQFNLGDNLENLSLVLGLLKDLTKKDDQEYFSYGKRVVRFDAK